MTRGRVDGDPIGSEKPRGKARNERRGRNDPGFTPSEHRKRDVLMKQFCRLEGPSGNSEAYQASPAWCSGCNGRRLAVLDGLCESCDVARRTDASAGPETFRESAEDATPWPQAC